MVCLLAVPDSADAKVIASSGFSPTRNGFSFANYGRGPANLSANEMRALFGSGVCAFVTKSKRCVLTPPARRYMDNANRSMAGGHCFGMSTLSLLLFRHQFPPLAGTPINRLRLQRNTQLQHAIAYMFQWQMLPAVQYATVGGTPNKLLQFLTDSLRRRGGELYTMEIFQPGLQGGHAITPYAVDNRGGGRYDVLVYDNNWPDQARRVHFDTHSDTWRYMAGAKGAPGAVYRGNAKTGTLYLAPSTPGLGVHFCPFCASAAGRPNAYNEIQLQGNPYGHAHLLIRDERGRALGYEGGKVVSQIPGARAVFPAAVPVWQQRQEPVYRLPFGVNVQVTVDGSGLRSPDTEHFSLIGQNHDLAIDGIEVRPGERERITLKGGAQASMTYTGAGSQNVSPFFNVGLVRRPGNYSIGTQAQSLHSDSVITISDDAATSTLSVHDASARGQTFQFQLTQQVHGKVKKVRTATVYQPPDKSVHLLYGNNVPADQRIQIV